MPKKPKLSSAISASALKSGLGGGGKGKAKFKTTGDLLDGAANGEPRPRRRSARVEPKKFARELGSGSEMVGGHGVAHMAERLCGVMGPGVVQLIAVLEKASHQQFVRGSELTSLAAKISSGADAIETLRLLHELLEMHSMRLDFNWVHASPLLDALLQKLEEAAATWLRAQLSGTILLDTDAWSLTKLGEAVRALKAGGVPQLEEFVASNAEPQPLAALKASHANMWQDFKDEWQKMHVHLSDISGFPSWMPHLQELIWGRFEQLYYLFYSYASRSNASGLGAHGLAVSMGPSEFYMFVYDAKVTSAWLNVARVDDLFETVRAHYDVDADGLPVAGRHLHGFTRLHAFLEAVVRLALLKQDDPMYLPKRSFPNSLVVLLEQNLEKVESDLEFEQVLRRAVGAPIVRDALAKHGDTLRRAFATAAQESAAATAAATATTSQRPAVSVQAWLDLVRRAQLPIGKDVAMEIFMSSQAAALRHLMDKLQQDGLEVSGGGGSGGSSGGGDGGAGGGGGVAQTWGHALDFNEFQDALCRAAVLSRLKDLRSQVAKGSMTAPQLTSLTVEAVHEACRQVEQSGGRDGGKQRASAASARRSGGGGGFDGGASNRPSEMGGAAVNGAGGSAADANGDDGGMNHEERLAERMTQLKANDVDYEVAMEKLASQLVAAEQRLQQERTRHAAELMVYAHASQKVPGSVPARALLKSSRSSSPPSPLPRPAKFDADLFSKREPWSPETGGPLDPQGTPARTVGFRGYDSDDGGFGSPPSSRRVRSGRKKTGAFKSPGECRQSGGRRPFRGSSRSFESDDLSAYDGAVPMASL